MISQIGEVAAPVPDPAADQATGLERAHKLDQLGGLLFGHIARRIEPDQTQRPVIGEQLFYLRLAFLFRFPDICNGY